MSLADFLCVIVAPALAWGAYHRYHDRHQPEPYALLVVAFLLGIGAGALGVQAYRALELVSLRRDAFELAQHDRVALAVYAVLGIGLIEEGVKLLPFWLVVVRLEHFDEPLDGIVYASFIALGFAAYENVHYVSYLGPTEALLRGLASPLVHVMFSSIWGYLGARARVRGTPVAPALLCGLVIAAVAHGVYDFLTIGAGPWSRLLSALLILAIWTWRRQLVRLLTPPGNAGG